MEFETTESEAIRMSGAGLSLAADRWRPVGQAGKGVVLLLHGGGQTRHSWHHTGARLGSEGWDTYAVDLRGHGDSDWDPAGDYGMSAIAADIQEMVAHAKAQAPGLPVALVGASLGGKTSMIALGESPGLAQALVLVDIAVRVEAAGGRRVFDFMRSAPNGFASLEEAASSIAAYNPNRPRSGSLEGLKKNLRLRAGRWHWHWDPRVMTPPEAPEDPSASPLSEVIYERSKLAAQAITCPVLLVRGMKSDVVSDAGVAEMRRLVPHGTYVDVRDAGHMVAGDDNDIFTASLVGFLDQSLSPCIPSNRKSQS
ncbi:alpha/beta fold hydrolase [Tomitella biformata]|uniref:alpha/beta fold hydrolase n=1 Tax=Tomitella biformata TaxID=630403 RepID=UPI0004632CDE|nr:alpha/beta hydrolase [Tomitella biformata]